MDYRLAVWNPKGRADRLRNAQDVTRHYAEALCQRISRRIIRDCQARKDCLLSGDDTVLGNIWDEICVQIQDEESIYWDVYAEALSRMAFDYLVELADYEQLAIWLQTDDGWNWQWESENNPDELVNDHPDFLLDDLAHYLLRTYVYPAARRWSNRRVEAHLIRGQVFLQPEGVGAAFAFWSGVDEGVEHRAGKGGWRLVVGYQATDGQIAGGRKRLADGLYTNVRTSVLWQYSASLHPERSSHIPTLCPTPLAQTVFLSLVRSQRSKVAADLQPAI